MTLPLARKDAALLAFVAMNRGVPSTRAAELLWPQAAGRGALNNLRQRLHRLRKATSARLLEVGDTASLAEDLRVELAPEYAALEAHPHAWDGELLHGVELDDAPDFSTWLAAERKAWSERRRDALAAIASACEKSGELARALSYAQRLLAEGTLSEHAYRRLMRLHYRRGDAAAAVAVFEACERTLKDELGLAPSAETIDLLATIERGTLVAPTGPVPVPVSLLRPPRAVGREREFRLLIEAQHQGQIGVVVGEAGMGKTRLLQDFVAAHGQAVYAQARPGDVAVPYAALARLLRAVVAAAPSVLTPASRGELVRVVPEFGDPGPTGLPGQAARLQDAVERMLAAGAGQGGLTVVVDDLHFADRASIEMLRALVDASSLEEVRWVFAHRPIAAADEDGALLQTLADAPRARWIGLSPLSEADLGELLDSLALPGVDVASLAPALARHTGGNPLYVLETLRAAQTARPGNLELPRPEAIAHLIDRRLQRLSERALALGRVAALAGPDFGPALAESVLGTPAMLLAGAWAELEAADVLRGAAFAHDLVRDGMLRATPRPIAAHAHGLIAQLLERQGTEAARVAVHWWAAEKWAQAGAAFREAAAEARRLGRQRERAQLLLRAAEAHERGDDPQAATKARADAVDALLNSSGSDSALELSQALVAQVGTGAHAAFAWSQHAVALSWAGRAAESEQAARKALGLARPDEEALRLECTLTAAQACGLQGRADEGIALLHPWEERIDHIDDADAAYRIGFCAAYANLMIQADRPADTLPWIWKHLTFAEAAGNVLERMTARMNLGGYFLREGDLEAAVDHAQQADALVPDDEQAQGLARWNRNGLGYMLCGLGRFDEGLGILEAELAASEGAQGALRALQELWLADIMIVLGQFTRAHRLLASDASPGVRLHKRLLVKAALARALGNDDGELLAQALEAADRPSTMFERLHADIQLASRRDDAAPRLLELAGQANVRKYRPLAVLALQGRLQALLRQRRIAEAAAETPELEAVSRRYRHPTVYLPDVLRTCSAVWTAAGNAGEARRCLTEAVHWVHSVALPAIPALYRDSFLQRNGANLALQADFTRMLAAST